MNISYSNPILREFEKELSIFKEGKFAAVNIDKYLLSKGIYAPQDEGYPPALVEGRIRDYEAFQEKFNALIRLQRQTTHAKGRSLQELAPEIPKEKETPAEKRHKTYLDNLKDQGYELDTTQSPPRWVKKEVV